MIKKYFPTDSVLYLGLILSLLSYDYYTVILQPRDLLELSSLEDLVSLDVHHGFLHRESSPLDWLSGEKMTRQRENDLYIRRAIQSFRSRPPLIQFNAELGGQVAVLSPPSVRTGPANVSAAAAAASEALGDLFMSEIYLQGDLDLNEITAVAGFVSKEDMDVQRLVDVLWSQEIDLGAGRETFEYPIHPPKDVRQKAEAKLETFPGSGAVFPYSATQRDSEGFERFLVDDETGEVTARTAAGNDSRDPFNNIPSNATQFYPPAQFGQGSNLQNSTASTSDVLTEDQQLQSLIEALNCLNSSTLQAVVGQGQLSTGKNVEEQWQDVESVISPSQQGVALANRYNATSSGNSVSDTGSIPSGSNRTQSQSNSSQDLNSFDLFSMFMDPPKNWTLPSVNCSPNSTDYFSCLSTGSYSGENAYGQNSDKGIVSNGPSVDMFGITSRTASQQQTLPSLVHEGPFDFSAFSYAQPPLVPQQQQDSNYPSVPLMDQSNNSLYSNNWNMSDWHGVGVDMNDFQSSHLGSSTPNSTADYFESSGAAAPASWKLLQDFQPTSNNISDAFLLLDDSKLQLLDLERPVSADQKVVLVREIKQEEVEDPWSEHVNFATGHNHTYASGGSARLQGRSHESREGSEDDQGSFSGSTGSASTDAHGRSRQSRDDRAASELSLPVTAEEIIAMPVEEFNGYIGGQAAQLHNDQIQLMKDIRRRGKNKVAAQNCRRRKIDNMSHLEREIMGLQSELKGAQSRHEELVRERDRYRAVLRTSVIQDGSSGNLVQPGTSSGGSVIVMSGGTVTKGVRRQDSGESSKPLRKRKRDE